MADRYTRLHSRHSDLVGQRDPRSQFEFAADVFDALDDCRSGSFPDGFDRILRYATDDPLEAERIAGAEADLTRVRVSLCFIPLSGSFTPLSEPAELCLAAGRARRADRRKRRRQDDDRETPDAALRSDRRRDSSRWYRPARVRSR